MSGGMSLMAFIGGLAPRDLGAAVRIGGCALAALVGMEAWAAVLHRIGWHGPLWWAHRSHHRGRYDIAAGTEPRDSGLELNDIFGPLHAAVAAPVMAYGIHVRTSVHGQVLLGLALGMTLFGLAYAIIHDGLCHKRLPVSLLSKSRYLQRVARAHAVHHRTGGAPFGLFTGPWVLRRAARQRAYVRSQKIAAAPLDFAARLR